MRVLGRGFVRRLDHDRGFLHDVFHQGHMEFGIGSFSLWLHSSMSSTSSTTARLRRHRDAGRQPEAVQVVFDIAV
jgi:hypothetical protein